MRHSRVLGFTALLLAASTLQPLRAGQEPPPGDDPGPAIFQIQTGQLRSLIDPRDGSVFQSFSVQGAVDAIRAVSAVGQPHKLDVVLASLAEIPREPGAALISQGVPTAPTCFNLIADGKSFHFNLRGDAPAYAIDVATGKHIAQFSASDAKAIYDGLDAAGVSTVSIMKALFDLHVNTRSGDSTGAIDIDPINWYDVDVVPAEWEPHCGECEPGSLGPTGPRPSGWCWYLCLWRGGTPQECWTSCGGDLKCNPGPRGDCDSCKVCADGPPDVDPTD